jgi:hypothetical protein
LQAANQGSNLVDYASAVLEHGALPVSRGDVQALHGKRREEPFKRDIVSLAVLGDDLFLYWSGFDGSAAFAASLAVDFGNFRVQFLNRCGFDEALFTHLVASVQFSIFFCLG